MVQNKDSRTLLQAVSQPDIQRSRLSFPLKAPGSLFANRIVCSIGESQDRSSYRELECWLGSTLPSRRGPEIAQKIQCIARFAGCGCTIELTLDKLELSEPTISISARIQTFNPRIPLSLLAGIADLLDGVSFSLNPDKRQYTVWFSEQSVRNLSSEVLDRLAQVIMLTKQSRLA